MAIWETKSCEGVRLADAVVVVADAVVVVVAAAVVVVVAAAALISIFYLSPKLIF